MKYLGIRLSDEQAEGLDEIALDHDSEFRAAIQQGIEEADQGDVEDFDVFAADMRAEMAARVTAYPTIEAG